MGISWKNMASGLVLIFVLLSPGEVMAQMPGQKILIHVNGLACPFCDFGLSKALKKLKGVDNAELDLNEGLVELTLKPGQTVSKEVIKQTVEDAGFTPPDDSDIIVVSATGSAE